MLNVEVDNIRSCLLRIPSTKNYVTPETMVLKIDKIQQNDHIWLTEKKGQRGDAG
jgi:uncharacterized protein involved in tolerance to divalent cations